MRVGDSSPAEVVVYDLSGRQVRKLVESRAVSTGPRSLRWDGRDDGGQIELPGVYYARLRVATETFGADVENAEVLRTVSVAYYTRALHVDLSKHIGLNLLAVSIATKPCSNCVVYLMRLS